MARATGKTGLMVRGPDMGAGVHRDYLQLSLDYKGRDIILRMISAISLGWDSSYLVAHLVFHRVIGIARRQDPTGQTASETRELATTGSPPQAAKNCSGPG
jgi:hypothetical protein